jgi:protein-tyrosine-phosphatase
MLPFQKILFIGTDNACPSILAEAVMNSIKGDRNLIVESRGLVVLFPEPLNPKAVAVLKSKGMEPSKKYTQAFLPQEDVTEGTLILTMSEKEKEQVLELQNQFAAPAEVYTLAEVSHQQGDILTPYGGTLADYGAYYEYIDIVVKMAAERLFRLEDEAKPSEE